MSAEFSPDVLLYIQPPSVLSACMLTCPECNGPWVMKTNWRYQTANGSWWSLSFCSAFHFHPSPSFSPALSYLQMKCWSVEEICPPPTPASLLSLNLSFHLSLPDISVLTEWIGEWSNYTWDVQGWSSNHRPVHLLSSESWLWLCICVREQQKRRAWWQIFFYLFFLFVNVYKLCV